MFDGGTALEKHRGYELDVVRSNSYIARRSFQIPGNPKSRQNAQNAQAQFTHPYPGTGIPSSSGIPIYRWHVNQSAKKFG